MWWIKSSGLLAAVELDLPGRGLGQLVAAVVSPAVVPGAQGDAVLDAGAATVDPSGVVVGVESGAAVAAFGAAALVADQDRETLVFGVESLLAAHVEGHGVAAEDGRDDPRLTGQLAGEGRADAFSGVEGAGLLEATHE